MNIIINKYFKECNIINEITNNSNKYNIISYCCGKYPSIGGVERYDAQLKMIFPNRVFFQGPSEKEKMLEYLKNTKNPIIITDNHLSCDIPNEYPVLLVHHGCARTTAQRTPDWNNNIKEFCCNGQDKMLTYRNIYNTWIISISESCSDDFKKIYQDKYLKFNRFYILHASEFDYSLYKKKFNDKPIILGNWNHPKKGQQIIPIIKSLTNKFEFKQLQIKPNLNESIEDFNKRKQQIYLDSDIFLQLSVSEGNSYASLDALVCGLVVVASNVGAFYKDVPGDCFVKIPWEKNNDVNFVMERIEYAWNNKELLSRNARKWILENCSFDLWKKKMYKIVKKFNEHNYP
jgi:glycosyltransferase involved in cell wall biosynthesis